ncbi:cytochrome P450 6a2 isoform X2 [Bemisia tabaci]|uniref:cytochrome P450 6a2 isoform X2 n=1 Tax=Bemisia tabaci TaxID=7038 RepID=UPI003B28B7B5
MIRCFKHSFPVIKSDDTHSSTTKSEMEPTAVNGLINRSYLSFKPLCCRYYENMPDFHDWIHVTYSTQTSVGLMIIACLCIIGFTLKRFTYWRRHGVAQINPPFWQNFSRKEKPIALVYEAHYKALSNVPFGGFYEHGKPVLLVRDPALIQKMLTTYFSYFPDRRAFLNTEKDSCSSHLLNLTGERWRKIRKKIVPSFRTPSKLTDLKVKIKTGIEAFELYLNRACEGKGTLEVDFHDLMARLTTHIIGLTAASIPTDALMDGESSFRNIQELLCVPNWRMYWRDLFRHVCPPLNDVFNLKGHDKRIDLFFIQLVAQQEEARRTGGLAKDDFLQNLLDLKNAGFSTIAITLTYAFYEAVNNIEIWIKLRREVDSMQQDEKIDYEKLTYTTAVIQETLRKYSVFPSLQRQCSQDFEIPGTSVVIKKGVDVIIPIYAIHRDRMHWPDPDLFRPERFLERQPKSGTYLPFGDGSRMCPGYKYAFLELQMIMTFLIKNYDIVPCETTPLPKELRFLARGVLLHPENGIFMRIKRRRKI